MIKIIERKTLAHVAFGQEDLTAQGYARVKEDALKTLGQAYDQAIHERGINQPKRIFRFKLLEEELE